MLSAKTKKTVGKLITYAVLLHRASGLDGEKFPYDSRRNLYGAGQMGTG